MTTPALDAAPRDRRDAALAKATNAVRQAADHFDEIGRKAEHWCRVLANSEIGEARWARIMRHARHRANECRATLADIEELLR
jgi:hypothetical protein